MELSVKEQRETLSTVLMDDDVAGALWSFVDSGLADKIVPELPALRLEQDPIHRHKEVLSHTIAVTAKTTPDLVLRLAALFHDIGKPATRRIHDGGVTFRHHEAVGAGLAVVRQPARGGARCPPFQPKPGGQRKGRFRATSPPRQRSRQA